MVVVWLCDVCGYDKMFCVLWGMWGVLLWCNDVMLGYGVDVEWCVCFWLDFFGVYVVGEFEYF